jgi:hypothetical protein
MASGSTSGFRFAEVGCVAMDNENHVTCLIGEDGVLMARPLVEEQFDVCHDFFVGFGLSGHNGT